MFWRTWRYYVGLLGLLLGLSACVTEDLRNPIAEGQGYLRLELASVATELSSSSQTKASTASIPSEDIPDASDFTIDIQKGGTSVDGFPKKFSELGRSSLVLETGDYTVSAYCGENALIQTKPYFWGSSIVTVLPNQQVSASIETALANTLLIPAVDESLQKHYSTWALTLKVGEESMQLASKENSNNHLYVKAGQSVTGIFNGKNLAEKETSTEWTVISETVSCTQYTIQCNPDLSIFSNIQLTAKATHNYNNGSLTGTDVILNLSANGAPVEAIASWDIKVLYNGETIRTYSNNPDNATMNVLEGWPYVPQGSTLSASILLKAGDKIDLSSTTMETIPMPTFTATVSGKTSYSVYKSSGASAANKMDGSSIIAAATVNISSDILNNANYSNLLKVTYTTDGGGDSGELPYGTGKLTGLTWQKHALTATVSFDGGTATAPSVNCHITGLPYSFNFYNNKSGLNNSDWTQVNVKYEGSKCTIQNDGSNGYLISPKFHIPSPISTDYSIQAQYYRAWLISVSSKSINLQIGTTSSNASVATNYTAHTCSGNNNTGESYGTYTGILDFSLGEPYVSFYHNRANVSAQVDYLCLYGFTLQYK